MKHAVLSLFSLVSLSLTNIAAGASISHWTALVDSKLFQDESVCNDAAADLARSFKEQFKLTDVLGHCHFYSGDSWGIVFSFNQKPDMETLEELTAGTEALDNPVVRVRYVMEQRERTMTVWGNGGFMQIIKTYTKRRAVYQTIPMNFSSLEECRASIHQPDFDMPTNEAIAVPAGRFVARTCITAANRSETNPKFQFLYLVQLDHLEKMAK